MTGCAAVISKMGRENLDLPFLHIAKMWDIFQRCTHLKERKWTVNPPFPTRCQVIQLQGQVLNIIPLWITITVTIMMTHKIIHMRVIKNSYKHNYDLIFKNVIKKIY